MRVHATALCIDVLLLAASGTRALASLATTYPPEKATPAALQAHLKSEIDKWGPLIKKAGVYAD